LDEARAPTGVLLRNSVELIYGHVWYWMYFEDKHYPFAWKLA